MRPTLTSLTIRGFKTIREMKDFDPGRITVLIGSNGAGNSIFSANDRVSQEPPVLEPEPLLARRRPLVRTRGNG